MPLQLYFKKINRSAFSGRRWLPYSPIMSPSVLKRCSEGTFVAGGYQALCITLATHNTLFLTWLDFGFAIAGAEIWYIPNTQWWMKPHWRT